MVKFRRIQRTYSYIADDNTIQKDDFVTVPFGKDNFKKVGQVTMVKHCTASDAPFPPEKTKHILSKTEKPENWDSPVYKTVKAGPPEPTKEHIPSLLQEASSDEPETLFEQNDEERGEGANNTLHSIAMPEAVEKTPQRNRKPFFSIKKVALLLVLIALIGGIAFSMIRRNQYRENAYADALQEMSSGDYVEAEQSFSQLSNYRDSQAFAVYCKYADIYEDQSEYIGGKEELAAISLKYNTEKQPVIDALEECVSGYKAEKEAAEEAERREQAAKEAAEKEKRLKEQYSGKLPDEGMPMSCLKYTSLGSPDKEEKCVDFDKKVEARRSISLYWYGSDGKLLAAATCFKHEKDTEFMLYSFSYYDPSTTNEGQTFNYGGNSDNSGSIRDDYDNPEDLWEDNQDWYEDEDEAWDEWYDGQPLGEVEG